MNTTLDFGDLHFGEAKHQLYQMPDAPAATNVMASIIDNSRAFSVGRVIVRRSIRMQPVDPSELPPKHKGPPPKQQVWEQVADSDGSTPVSTEAGDILDVYIDLRMPPHAEPGEHHGTLTVTGATGTIATAALTASFIVRASTEGP